MEISLSKPVTSEKGDHLFLLFLDSVVIRCAFFSSRREEEEEEKKSTLVTPLFIPVLHYVLSTWFSRLFRRPENTQRILDCPALQQY